LGENALSVFGVHARRYSWKASAKAADQPSTPLQQLHPARYQNCGPSGPRLVRLLSRTIRAEPTLLTRLVQQCALSKEDCGLTGSMARPLYGNNIAEFKRPELHLSP